jgi:hypothetical protein
MTGFAVVVLITAAVVSVIVLAAWRRRVNLTDIGSMSGHWVAEHQASERDVAER